MSAYQDPNQGNIPVGYAYPPDGPRYPPPPSYPPVGAPQYPPQYPPSAYPPPEQQPPPYNPPGQSGVVHADPPPYVVEPKDDPTFADDTGIVSFSEKSVRQGFIRKVYSLLFLQLLVTLAIICAFVFSHSLNSFARRSAGMFWSAWVLTIVVMVVIVCCEKARRSFPLNIIMLALFTLCESYLLGVVSAHYQVDEVLLAVGIVAVLSLAITIFAFQTKIDFTMMSGCLFVVLIVLICFGFLTIFFHSKILRLVYASLGALVFGLYLIMDTQLIMGGNKKYSISPDEYIFAALNLYVDIVTLFLYILQIIGLSK